MPPPPPPPPPGPPPSASAAPPKLSKNDAQNRSALLGDICKGKRLKPSAHLTVDKSKPIVGSEGKSNKFGTVAGSRGLDRRINGGGPTSSAMDTTRGRSNAASGAPPLAGLFAGGMPTLKKTNIPNGNSRAGSTPKPPPPSRSGPAQINGATRKHINQAPPPPPSLSSKPALKSLDASNQQKLIGQGANGSSGLFPPPPPPMHHQSLTSLNKPAPPPQQNKPSFSTTRAPPPPPPSQPPPPPSQYSSHTSLSQRNKSRTVLGPPPPPPRVQSNNAPPPPAPSRLSITSNSIAPPPPPSPMKNRPSKRSSGLETRFDFHVDLPPAPGVFSNRHHNYPSQKSKAPSNRPCPPPPPPLQ